MKFLEDYVAWSRTEQNVTDQKSSLVFVGYGIEAPEFGWDDYKGVDVTGKTLLMLVNDPGLVDATVFLGKILTYYGRWTYKLEEAARQGVRGIDRDPETPLDRGSGQL